MTNRNSGNDQDDRPSYVGKVTFKGMSVSNGKARISMRLDCDRDCLLDLYDLLSDAQLECDLNIAPGSVADINDKSGMQATMEGTTIRVTGVAECNGFGARKDHINASLAFNETAIDSASLVKLEGKEGNVDMVRIGSAADGEEE